MGSERASSWADSLVGRTLLSRFEVESVLGVGGMGAVLAARDLKHEREVALKILLPGVRHDTTVVKRFHREATAAASVSQRGVVNVLDFAPHPDLGPLLVLERLHGESLLTRLRRGRLELDETLEVILPLLETLEAVHGEGIVHRDLKPANVFLREVAGEARPRVTLVDFGISRIRRSLAASGITDPGTVLGTLRYMPPEQARGEEVDHRADLYSTGLLCFACLSGKPPHAGVPTRLLPMVVPRESPGDLREERSDLPEGILSFVERAISRDPTVRFETALEMRESLKRSAGQLEESQVRPPLAPQAHVIDDGPTVVSPPFDTGSQRKWAVGALGCTLLLVAALIAGAGAFWLAASNSDTAAAIFGSFGD